MQAVRQCVIATAPHAHAGSAEETVHESALQFGGQGVSGNEELGGPWTCPTPPQYSNGSCDPCGENRPVPYWGVRRRHPFCCQAAPAVCHIQNSNCCCRDVCQHLASRDILKVTCLVCR